MRLRVRIPAPRQVEKMEQGKKFTKKFTRKKEDFVCEQCKKEVKGNGYTNHCPFCLWSKHVDVMPGDRLALETCGGMMKPLSIEGSTSSGYSILHECVLCGHTKRNKVAPNDDQDKILSIIKKAGSLL